MSLKITHYTKDKENHNFGKERKSTIANTEIYLKSDARIIWQSDKDCNGAIIEILQSQLESLKKNKN